jgi:phosphoketolase
MSDGLTREQLGYGYRPYLEAGSDPRQMHQQPFERLVRGHRSGLGRGDRARRCAPSGIGIWEWASNDKDREPGACAKSQLVRPSLASARVACTRRRAGALDFCPKNK